MLIRPPRRHTFDNRGLVCWAPLDAALFTDLSGVNGIGHPGGVALIKSGKASQNGYLPGIAFGSNQIIFPTDAKLPLGASQRTVSIFFATTASAVNNPMLCWGTGATQQAVIFYGGNTANKLSVDSFGTAWSANTVINDGKLHHACFTYDGTNTVIYLDGVQDGTSTANAFNTVSSGVFSIAHDVAGRFYLGFLANLRIYKRRLSVPEIQMLAKEPFATPIDIETIALMSYGAALGTTFRRTLSPIGTRTGSRQRIMG